MREIWLPVKEYEGHYEVSNLGRIKSFKNKEPYIMSLSIGRDGYPKTVLCLNGKKKTVAVHRLVADAFIPKADGLNIVEHIDSNPSNCRVDNLKWSTVGENTKTMLKFKRFDQLLQIKTPVGWRKGQTIFQFLWWLNLKKGYSPQSSTALSFLDMADPYVIPDVELERLYEQFYEHYKTKL